MYFFKVIILSAFCCCCFTLVVGDIRLDSIKCGVRKCNLSEYCSELDATCQPCSGICDQSHHNYDAHICEKQCQDYLHDQRYMKKDDVDSSLRSTVAQLTRTVTVTLTLVCLMLVVLTSVLCFQLYRWKIKKNITLASLKNKIFNKQAQSSNEPPKTTNTSPATTNNENKKADLRINMPSVRSNSDHSPATVTTSISRRPAEDSTLDYAYDNPAMSTPTR